MAYKSKEKIKEYRKEYNKNHKEGKKKYNKEYRENHKEELKEYHKKYWEKNRNEFAKRSKEYREKNKEKIKKYRKEYCEKNKEKISMHKKEYREKNKEKIKKHKKEYYEKNINSIEKKDKQRNKKLYLSSVKKLCNYYKIIKPICFFDMKEAPFKFEVTKEDIIKQNFIAIDHKNENLTGLKDKYVGGNLERHILNSTENELNNYQLLCVKHNLDKKALYEYYLALKEIKAPEADEIYKAYEDLFIYDKEKLHRKLREMGREDLIKGEDDNNAI